jgi:hypothetical protein
MNPARLLLMLPRTLLETTPQRLADNCLNDARPYFEERARRERDNFHPYLARL